MEIKGSVASAAQTFCFGSGGKWSVVRKRESALWSLSSLIIDRIKPFVLSRIRPDMLEPVFGVVRKTKLPPGRTPTPTEQYWLNWFREITEIHASIDRLSEALAYIGQYPAIKAFRFHGISEASWTRYHVEMYLQEEYILFNRLRGFLTRLKRTATRASNSGGAKAAANLLVGTAQAFRTVIESRGSHVHEARVSDNDLRDLDLFVLLAKRSNEKRRAFMFVRKLQAEFVKASWKGRLRQNNKAIRELCTRIFDIVAPILIACEPKQA